MFTLACKYDTILLMRKITIDGTVHEYIVGRYETRIKGIGLFKNRDIGNCITRVTDPRSSTGENYVEVAPRHIEAVIRKNFC